MNAQDMPKVAVRFCPSGRSPMNFFDDGIDGWFVEGWFFSLDFSRRWDFLVVEGCVLRENVTTAQWAELINDPRIEGKLAVSPVRFKEEPAVPADRQTIETVAIVKMIPTKIWIESGLFGERYVVTQHEGYPAFDYAVFNYDHYYTSNSSTMNQAKAVALSIGAVEPIEVKQRVFAPGPSKEEWMPDLLARQEYARLKGWVA